jgi:hypothetical protein
VMEPAQNLQEILADKGFSAGDIDVTELAHVEVTGNLGKCSHDFLASEFIIVISVFSRGTAMDAIKIAPTRRLPAYDMKRALADKSLDLLPPKIERLGNCRLTRHLPKTVLK